VSSVTVEVTEGLDKFYGFSSKMLPLLLRLSPQDMRCALLSRSIEIIHMSSVKVGVSSWVRVSRLHCMHIRDGHGGLQVGLSSEIMLFRWEFYARSASIVYNRRGRKHVGNAGNDRRRVEIVLHHLPSMA
jgi:hypothetical protein